jgi:membrane protein
VSLRPGAWMELRGAAEPREQPLDQPRTEGVAQGFVSSRQTRGHEAGSVARGVSVIDGLERAWDAGEAAVVALLSKTALGRFVLAVWRDLMKMSFLRIASAIAFDLFLALVPLLAFAGWVLGALLKQSEATLRVVSGVLDLAPGEAREMLVSGFLRSGVIIGPAALIGALWIASGAFHTMVDLFETVARGEPAFLRPVARLALLSVFASVLALGITGFVGVTVSGGPELLLERLFKRSSSALGAGAPAIAFVVAGASCVSALALFYRFAVRRPGVKRTVWPGAVLAVLAGGAVSWAFAYYARAIARFALFYGSLAAVAIVLFWLWLCAIVLLVGAAVNTELEERRRVTS